MQPLTPQSTEDAFIQGFDEKIAAQAKLNVLSGLAVLIEFGILILLLPFFIQSALVAFMLALFVLTIFGYLMLRQYLESQKKSDFEALILSLKDQFRTKLSSNITPAEEHVELAKLYCRLADKLFRREYNYYPLPKKLKFLSPWNESFSAWMHFLDVHEMRELLMQKSVEEHVQLVRKEPTNPDAHALLANAYVMLSGLYVDQKALEGKDVDPKSPKLKYAAQMQSAFKEAAHKAIEEFKILKDYAPSDPWIYTQLAYSYKDLQMPKEEQEAYEKILELKPEDLDIQFKLGTLYFKQGENARGLKVFEELKKARYSKADELLNMYGAK